MAELPIIFESNQLLVVNKPAGLITERSPFEKTTVESLAFDHLNTVKKKPYLGVVHRLDRVTSGVLLFTKNKSTLVALNDAFSRREVQKTYFAITDSRPPKAKGILDNYLMTDKKSKSAQVVPTATGGAKHAILRYQILEESQGKFLLKIEPNTGRFHQIRAQLAHIGCPIIGDQKYGSTTPYIDRSIALHAGHLKLQQPINENTPLSFTAPFPSTKLWEEFTFPM